MAQDNFKPLEVAPGVVNEASKAKNSVSWREVNLVRWDNGYMEPIGGWSKFNYTAPSAVVRAIHVWKDNNRVEWTAYLCDGKLYVEYEGDLYDISPTPAIAATSADFSAGGYGDGLYNYSTYGTARPNQPDRKEVGPAFKLDNWGENLLAMSSADGRLLEWVPSLPPDPAEVVLNAPTSCRTFVVTPERHVMVFEPGGVFNEYAWCDQEDNTDWDYASLTSKAGSYPVEPSAPNAAAINLGEDGTLFFSTKLAYVTRYIGLPYVYDKGDEVGEGVTPVSQASLQRALSGAMWPSDSGFWYFNGTSVQPIECNIWAWIKTQIDWDMARYTATAVNMVDKSEYWWFFPASGSSKNNRVVIYNYKDQWWSMGKLSRSAAFSANFIGYPIMADELNIYRHNDGGVYSGADEGPWAESFVWNVVGGGMFSTVMQLQPEVTGDYENVRYSVAVATRRTPSDERYTSQRSIQSNGYVDINETGRDFRLRVDYIGSSVLPWGMGQLLVSLKPRGSKP